MRVAIDTGPLTSGHKIRGVGSHTRNLIEGLGQRVEAVDFRKENLNKYDLLHYPYFSPFQKTLPLIKPSKAVVTVHDLIPLIYPQYYRPGVRGKTNFYLQRYLIKKVDAVITISETSKKDIIRFLPVPKEKVFVIYLAPGENFQKIKDKDRLKRVRKKYKLPTKFILYVGDVNYNKNIPGLIKACQLAKVPLVIVGKQALEVEEQDLNHPELRHLKPVLKDLKDSQKILRLGFVSDSDLVAIYNLATVYCQPSFYEGFGLPVLEAMACETPVVAARTQVLVEIAEAAALFAEPENPRDLAEKIKEVTTDKVLRRQLIETGKVLVKNYSWSKTAQETYNVYKKVISQ